jgi:tRNA A-37 threonylcarbamoyl transferase component Bud32/tetratricopeptide (TPR) repeat protein
VSTPLLQMPGARIGRYEVLECIGAGGMGIIYTARDPKLDRKVALKIVRNTTASSEVRLLREAQAMARLSHPNVVTVHDAVVHEGELVIAMELVPGVTLAQWLAVRERDWTEVVGVFVQAGRGLAAAHAAGLIHRDFKPSNVFVRDDGRVQVGDFGLARASDSTDGELPDDHEVQSRSPLEADVTQRGAMVGTPRYMAPEQRRGEADERSDQYSFARALHEALLHTSENQITAPADDGEEEQPPLPSINKVIPTAIKGIIARGTEADPERRYPSIAAMVAVLERARDTGAAPRAARRPAGFLLAGLALAAIAVAGVFVLRGGDTTPAVAPEVVVAMLPFANHSGEAENDWTRAGLPRFLGDELRSADARVIGTFVLRDRAPNPPPDADVAGWRERAAEMGARLTLSGVVHNDGHGGVVVAFTLARVDGVAVRTWVVQGAKTAILDLVGRQAREVVLAAGRVPTGPTVPRDIAVERDFTLGIEAFQELQLARARSLFEKVLRKEPGRAEALYYLAFTLWWANESREVVDAVSKRALAADLIPEQRGVLVGLMKLVAHDYAGAIEHFRRLDEQFPASSQVRYALTEALFHGGYPAEGMKVYRQLVDRVPNFHIGLLGLLHPLTHYSVHRDEAGMQWALSKMPQKDFGWGARLQIMRGDHRGAFRAHLEAREQARARKEPFALEVDLAILAVVFDDEAVIGSISIDHQWLALALAVRRGDRAKMLERFDAALSSGGPDERANNRRLRFIVSRLLPLVAIAGDRELAERSLVALERVVGTGNSSVDEQLGRAFLYALLGRNDELRRVSSTVPEVSTVTKALVANLDGKPAAELWNRAFELSADGVFVIAGRFYFAKALVAAGDHAGVIAQCEAILRPHFIDVAVAAAVPQCLAWTAAAHEALGHGDEAEAAKRRLGKLQRP